MLTPIDRNIHLKQVYSELDRKFEEEEAQRRALKFQLPYFSLYRFPIDSASLSLIPRADAEAAGLVVFFKEGRNLKLGAVEPSATVQKIIGGLKTKRYFVELYLISRSSLNYALSFYERVIESDLKSNDIHISSQDKGFAITSFEELGKKLEQLTATDLLKTVLGVALALDGSDIHFEPSKQAVKIRYRVDGVLQDAANLPRDVYQQVLSRVKLMAKLKLNLSAQPQDGSFSVTYDDLPVDIRVSVLPSAYGETVVFRLLRQDKQQLKFEDLGIQGVARERLFAEMRKPNGMILTTGPTGSGKTTTLYAILSTLNEPGVKIITLEDPVEYKIPGITQTPISKGAGLTFAAGLRAVLRQDPDIVMVGEMRDLETAEVASQAALTGHIVLSTLHTNDAAGALPRLLDLGVKPFVLAPAINAIIGQRLVRRLCEHCKTEYSPDKTLLERVKIILNKLPEHAGVSVPERLKFYHSPGCPACKGLGYKGRTGVYEVFTISESIEKLVQKQATTSEIKRQAVAEGMVTMAQDGLLKALAGTTDIEEVFRVTEE